MHFRRSPQKLTCSLTSPTITVPDVAQADLDQIITAVTSLYVVRASSEDVPLDRFVNDVFEAMKSFDRVFATDDRKHRLGAILSIEPLMIAAKAITILTDHERTFHTARILTDIRYAFRSDPEQKPYGAVIVHTLKLSYHQEGEHKQFFMALETEDLARLKTVAERAQQKEKAIRRDLEATGITYLGSNEEGE